MRNRFHQLIERKTIFKVSEILVKETKKEEEKKYTREIIIKTENGQIIITLHALDNEQNLKISYD